MVEATVVFSTNPQLFLITGGRYIVIIKHCFILCREIFYVLGKVHSRCVCFCIGRNFVILKSESVVSFFSL